MESVDIALPMRAIYATVYPQGGRFSRKPVTKNRQRSERRPLTEWIEASIHILGGAKAASTQPDQCAQVLYSWGHLDPDRLTFGLWYF